MYDIIINQKSETLLMKLIFNFLNEQRNDGYCFTRNNKMKIGFNCISNRLQVVSRKLNFEWTNLGREEFRMKCKKVFINNELVKL